MRCKELGLRRLRVEGRVSSRVSEPACFGAAPAPGIFIWSRLRLLVKENIGNFGIF